MTFLKKISWIAVLALAGCLQCKKARNSTSTNPTPPGGGVAIEATVLTQGLEYPWEILWGPDNYIWMTEREGRVSRVNPATGGVSPLFTIAEVSANNEGGLLGMVLHPNFASHPQVFVGYNYYNGSSYREKIVRYTYDGNTLINPFTIIDNIAASSIHNGCRMVITPDLKLFITTGDASDPSRSQNVNSLNGKVLRLNLDGSVPADNPISGNPAWSWGHRNAQGLVYAHNIMYSSEHGPTTDDEINLIEKGRNYGWPTVRGFCDDSGEESFCNSNNVIEPLKVWTPTSAACGMDYYDHNLIPQWKNSLLMAALKNARIYQMKLNGAYNSITETNEFFVNVFGRLRDVCVAPDGKVYICTSNGGNDKIIVINKK